LIKKYFKKIKKFNLIKYIFLKKIKLKKKIGGGSFGHLGVVGHFGHEVVRPSPFTKGFLAIFFFFFFSWPFGVGYGHLQFFLFNNLIK
jgi:hypothetical protein